MKKVLLLLAPMLFIVSNVSAQFKLTINSFVSAEDETKNYVVYYIDNSSKEELYTNVLVHLTNFYSSAKDVLSVVENEVITIHSKHPILIMYKKQNYDIEYSFPVNFRDGRIRIDAPSFYCSGVFGVFNKNHELTMSGSNGGFGSTVTTGLFKKDGRPNQQKTIEQIESFINTLIVQLVDSAANSSDDDW